MNGFKSLLPALFLAAAASLDASSHREAPFITEHPKVDATDFYMFRSYEPGREDYVTIVANYLPLQDPYGAPNYFTLDPDALYRINIDANGDAKEDFTFDFRFATINRQISFLIGGTNVPLALANVGAIDNADDTELNYNQTYRLTVTEQASDKKRRKSFAAVNGDNGSPTFKKPFDFVGEKSFPDYTGYARSFMYNVRLADGSLGRVFVGQRKDPFVINIGEIFDLVNVANPIGDPTVEKDDLADKNVTSIILELPISYLTSNGANPVLGGWTTASLPKETKLRNKPDFNRPADMKGGWVQVSRLGNPLVNELFIGLQDKNKFNNSQPKDDGQFLTYVTNPTLPQHIEFLFGGAGVKAPTLIPRQDLVAAFLTGVDGLNKTATPCEYLRLNTAIAPTAPGSQSNLGVIGGDNAGFPNGRRPGDDIVDIALRVGMGRLISLGLFGDPSQAPVGNLDFTDGANVDASFFDNAFPYLRNPLPGSRFED